MKSYELIRKILLIILIVFLILASICKAFGIKFYNASANQDEPDIKPNSLLIAKENAKSKIGDLIVFESNSGISVCKIVGETDSIYITKDLSKEAADSWQVDKSAVRGKVILSVPVIGIIFAALTSKIGSILLSLLVIALLASFLVAKPAAETAGDKNIYKDKYNELAGRYLNVLTLFAEKKMINTDFLNKEKERFKIEQ